jgi:uncharacterized protein (DUF4213/DUF364 family)
MILDELCKYVIDEAQYHSLDFKVIEAAVGLKYTYAIIEDVARHSKYIGLSYTPTEDITHQPMELKEVDNITMSNLCNFAKSSNFVSRSIALSVLNAISSRLLKLPNSSLGKDVLDVLDIRSNSRVAFVGYIEPLIRKIKSKAKDLFVFERNWLRRREAFPDTLIPRLLGDMELIIMSGATLLNDSLDWILHYARRDSVKVLVGATASVLPQPLFTAGIDYIGGFKVPEDEIAKVSELIKLGGGTREIYRHGFKYVVSREFML